MFHILVKFYCLKCMSFLQISFPLKLLFKVVYFKGRERENNNDSIFSFAAAFPQGQSQARRQELHPHFPHWWWTQVFGSSSAVFLGLLPWSWVGSWSARYFNWCLVWHCLVGRLNLPRTLSTCLKRWQEPKYLEHY